jgi:hypothetical protein
MKDEIYLNSLLESFAAMDICGLRSKLKNEYSYLETTKEIFLGHLENTFAEFRKSNDNELIISKGICANEECENFKKCGFRFTGNHSKNYLHLLFKKEENDVVDIHRCSNFMSEIETDENTYEIGLYIDYDDMIYFEKTAPYYKKVELALAAFNEIICTPPQLVCLKDIDNWLEKHNETNKLIGDYNVFEYVMKWTKFSILYANLKELSEFINNFNAEIIIANEQFFKISTEIEFKSWLKKYRKFYNKAPFYGNISYNAEGNYFEISQYKLKFYGHNLLEFFSLTSNYKQKQEELRVI